MNEDNGSDEFRRSTSNSWYSTYQSQVVGEPRTPWAQDAQESTTMKSGDAEELVGGFMVEDRQGLASKDNTEEDSRRDGGNHGPSDQNSRPLSLANGRSFDYELERDNASSDRQMFRPFSMVEFGQRSDENKPGDGSGGDDDDDDGKQKIQRSVSAFNWNDYYEEYKPPKRYQKPANKKINTRLSRTFVTGAGSDKCTKCGGRLYEMEKIHANHFSYHRSCFRCSQCQRLLNLTTFTSVDGQLFCKSHNLNVVSVMPGNLQPINGQRDDLPANEPNYYNGEEISTEVTLASISNMKSIFEVPPKLDDGAKKSAKHQKPEENKTIRQDFSFETRIHTEPPKVNQEDDIKIIKETNHMNPMFHQSDNRMAHRDIVHAPLANELNTTSGIITFKTEKGEDDDDDFKVSDAFAKFRSIEHQNEVRIFPQKEKKPAQKTTGPKLQEPTMSFPHSDVAPTSFVAPGGYKAPGYFYQGTGSQPMPKVVEGRVQSPVRNHYESSNTMKKYALNDSYLENGYANNTEIPEVEIQITGLTKRLRNHWESRDVQDGRQHQRHTTQGQGQGQGQGRGTGMNTAAHSTPAYGPATDVHVTNGFKTYGDDRSYRAETGLRKNAPERRVPVPVKDHNDVGSAWVGPMDFTQNQLAKFKQLEAMAVKTAHRSHPAKKTFRWGVKEVRPLHRPTSSYLQNDLTPDIFITTTTITTTTPPPHRLPTIQEHEWKNAPGPGYPLPSLPDGHEHGQTTYAVTHAPRDVIDSGETCLASVQETLAQFKSLEDLSRPSPNPVLAMSQQKAAMATAPKPYHDVIHSAYNVQVVAKE